MGKILFNGTFAYVVVDCQGLDCSVVQDDFLYAVFLAVGKLVVVQGNRARFLFVVGMAEKKVKASDCTHGKERYSRIFKKRLCSIGDHKGQLDDFNCKIDYDTEPRGKYVFKKKDYQKN